MYIPYSFPVSECFIVPVDTRRIIDGYLAWLPMHSTRGQTWDWNGSFWTHSTRVLNPWKLTPHQFSHSNSLGFTFDNVLTRQRSCDRSYCIKTRSFCPFFSYIIRARSFRTFFSYTITCLSGLLILNRYLHQCWLWLFHTLPCWQSWPSIYQLSLMISIVHHQRYIHVYIPC